MSGVIATKKFHESAILDQRIGKLKMGKTSPSSQEIKHYMELLEWAVQNSDDRIIKVLKDHEDYMQSHAAANKIQALFKSYKSNLDLAGDEKARGLLGVKRAAAYRALMAAKRMERSLLLLNKWISDRVGELAVAHPDKARNHKILFRFCDVHDVNTMRGKGYNCDESALKLAVEAAKLKETDLQRTWALNRTRENSKAHLSAKIEREKAERNLSSVLTFRRLAHEEKSRLGTAYKHISGSLKDVSPFVSTAENPSGFVETDNKVAQSIVRSPHNYVPGKEFTEFPKPAGKYAQAPYFAMFLIPANKLVSPGQLKADLMKTGSGQEAEQTLETVISAGEHLFWAKEGILPYMVASTPNPF